MKSHPTTLIEVLESRIAPARLIITGLPNGVNQDTDFNEAPFVNTEATPLDPISGAVGPGLVGVADTYYLRLSAGDVLQVATDSGGVGTGDFFVKVTAGNIVLFFIDKEDTNGVRNNEVDEADIVGISAGNGAKFELKAALSGDIVYNLNEQGSADLADDTLIMAGPMIPKMNAPGFRVGSSVGGVVFNAGVPELVGGKVLASGDISNVEISGNVNSILAGSAANGQTFDFFPKYIGAGDAVVDTLGGEGLFTFSPDAGKAGSSIKNITLDSITNRIEAGVGGESAKGGSISKVVVRDDSDGFKLVAGAGGTTGLKTSGGKGGSVTNIIVAGAADDSPNDVIELRAGAGGGSTTAVKGGAGGAVSKIFVGYRVLNGKILLSDDILRDDIAIFGGGGGDGKFGGKGGSVSALDVLTSTPEDAGDELFVGAGKGGASTSSVGGKSGAGGSVTKAGIRNVEISIGSDIGIYAGDAGDSLGTGTGAVGGLVSLVNLLGRQIQVQAGDGTDGKTGGKGGGLSKIVVESRDGVIPDALVFNAGIGGDGNAGKAGAGGKIDGITVGKADVRVLQINSGIHGDGGASIGGRGGAGGIVSNVRILDSDENATLGGFNQIQIRTGDGGDGDKGGGVGGSLSGLSFIGANIEPTVTTGAGGDATLKGKGGAGGSIKNIELSSAGQVRKLVAGVPENVDASTSVSAGAGGSGAGATGAGGAGGAISFASIKTSGFASIVGGDGGATAVGAKAAAGKGGTLLGVGAFGQAGIGELIAGDAGLGGARPAAGGSILGRSASAPAGLFAEFAITIRAGDGASGGAGGSIKNLGFGSTSSTLVPTPNGQILVQAGGGSASPDGKSVGKGGSLANLSGAVSNSGGDTFIRAGDGGSAPTKGAAGGSITGLAIQRGGSLGVELSIRAGDGGDALNGNVGGAGGSVSGVTVVEVSKEAIFRHLSAGDGGDAVKVGGKGGSISKVNVLDHDIGVRAGENYGFDTMGGIFAGAGGTAAKEGVNGSVTIINADSISAIVAGRGATPKLATKVENIYLNGTDTLKDSTGAFLPSIPGSQQVFRFGGFSTVATETTPGSGALNEVQTIDLAGVRALAAGAQFSLTFGGEETAQLPSNATLAEIEAALNALNSVRATGPLNTGAVALSGTDPTFVITFSSTGDVAGLVGAQVDPDETAPLPLDATAADVAAALNAEQFIIDAGGVTVRPSLPSGYQITFNVGGDRGQIFGQEIFDISSVDVASGLGNTALLVTETTVGGNEVHSFFPLEPFNFNITYTEGAEINSTVQLPASATADEVRLALEALPTIDPGDVTVTKRTSPEGVFEVRFSDLTDHETLDVVMFADPLQVQESFAGQFENLRKETQVIYVDPSGDGRITFSFGPDSFALSLNAGFTATQLENQLNLQPAILAQGRVIVTPLGANTYQVAFGKEGDQPEILVNEDRFPLGYANVVTEGAAGTREVVRFNHVPGAVVRFSMGAGLSTVVNPTGVGGTLVAADIRNAINNITPAITDNVDAVAVPGGDGAWQITFNQNGDRPLLNVGQRFDIAGDLHFRGVATTLVVGTTNPNPDVSEVQRVRTVDSGTFTLTLNGVSTGAIRAGATAAEVQTALQDVFTVTSPVNTVGVYDIQALAAGPMAQFIVEGTTVLQQNDETVAGALDLEQKEAQTVIYDGAGEFALHFPGGTEAQLITKGSKFAFEKQVVQLSGINGTPGTVFNFVFEGEKSASLPVAATRAQIETALNDMVSISAAGDVTVSETPGGVFNVVFKTLGQKPSLISVETKGADSTPILAGTSTPAQIATALNALPGVIAAGGVTVEQLVPGEINIVFNKAGQMPDFSANYRVRETQSIDFYNTGSFTVAYGTNPLDVSQPIPAGSSLADVQAAINAIPGVLGAGGVVVTNGNNSKYVIQFNNAGDLDTFSGTQRVDLANSTTVEGQGLPADIKEIQKIVKPRRFVFDQTNVVEGNYVGGFSDATEIGARVFRWNDANGNGLYEINEIPLDGLVAAKVFNQAKVNFTPEARIVGGSFGFVESQKGSATQQETQLLTIKADKYILTFGAESTTVLTGKASILAIQNALNALASIQATGPGGQGGFVTVGADATPNTFVVSFDSFGDQAPITAPFFYDYNNIF